MSGKYFLFIIVVIFSAGCKKQLEEEAFSAIYTKDFYSTASEAEAAITAVYGGLYDLYSSGAVVFAAEWSADQMFPRNVVGRSSLTLYTHDPEYSALSSFGRANESPLEIWRQAYRGIEKANWVIEKVPPIEMDTVRRNNILGEAYFLRAFFHWMLTKNFGDIVVKTSATSSIENGYVAKSTQKEVYQQVYLDLNMAVTLLPDYTPDIVSGRISKQVAELLLAKTALYDENWPVALEKAKAVITSGKYALMTSPADIYSAAMEDAARQETMFAVEMNGNLNPPRWSQVHYFYAPIVPSDYSKGGAGAMYAYSSFYNSFFENDKRKLLLDTSFTDANGNVITRALIDNRLVTKDLVLVGKYKDPNAIGAYGSNNIPVLRYADAFLIAAEAEARQNGATGEAYSFLNSIRQRAGIADLTAGLSAENFIDSTLRERSWEFFGEADRWYDLTRTNTFLQVIPAAVNADYPVRSPLAKHRYFPIPQLEVNANPMLEQNVDWK